MKLQWQVSEDEAVCVEFEIPRRKGAQDVAVF